MDKLIRQVFTTLYKTSDTLLSFYTKHEWYQFVLIVPLTIIAFLYGRSQQNKELQTMLLKLNNTDQYKIDLKKHKTTYLKREIQSKSILNTQIYILIGIILFTLFYYFTSLNQIIGIKKRYFYLFYFVYLMTLGITALVHRFLQKKSQNISQQIMNIQKEEIKDIEKLKTHLGSEIIRKLKRRFQLDINNDEKVRRKQKCKNVNCQQRMQILIQSNTFFEKIIKAMIDYQWCNMCKTQLQEEKIQAANIFLEDIKMGGQTLDDMKRFFNQLLEFYNSKQIELQQVCTNECCKQFYQVLKSLSEEYYKQISSYDQRTKNLK